MYPSFVLNHRVKRILIPKGLKLVLLGVLFYVGIWINLFLLEYEIPMIVNIFTVIAVLVLLAAQQILNYVNYNKYRYEFYADRIIYRAKRPITLMYSEIDRLGYKQNFFDKRFETGEIALSKKFSLKYIPNSTQVYYYIQRAAYPYSQYIQQVLARQQYQNVYNTRSTGAYQ